MPKIKRSKDLTKPVKSNEEGSVLARLLRSVINELNLVNRIDFLVTDYVRRGKNTATKHKTKSSMISAITADTLTWKQFVDIIFNVLRVESISITLTLKHRNGSKSLHSIDVSKRIERKDGEESTD